MFPIYHSNCRVELQKGQVEHCTPQAHKMRADSSIEQAQDSSEGIVVVSCI